MSLTRLQEIVQSTTILREASYAEMFINIAAQYNSGELTTKQQLWDILQSKKIDKGWLKQHPPTDNSVYLLELFEKVKPQPQINLSDNINNITS